MRYRVICREDCTPEGERGKYVLATSREFDNQPAAIEYAATIDQSREPRVLLDVTDMGVLPA